MQSLQKVEEQKKPENKLTVKMMCQTPKYVGRYAEVLGSQDKANQFLASVITVTNGSNLLRNCEPMAVMGCAMIAASLNLDVNPNLGFAYIIPYKKNVKTAKGWEKIDVPQFQMGYKGFIQLAMRSGQYKSMNAIEVYEDEFGGYDILRNKLTFNQQLNGQRSRKEEDKIVGFAFYCELLTGFEKTVYMSKEELKAHARAYSQSYQNDLKDGKKSSPWSTNFNSMCKKTLVKLTLSTFGILSTQMANAIKYDQSTANGMDVDEADYIDNNGEEIEDVEAEVRDVEEPKPNAQEVIKEAEAKAEELVF